MWKLAFALFLISTAANAAVDEKACIFAAAQNAPRIQGMTIDNSAVRPLPAEMADKWKGDEKPVIVDLKITAAGQQDTLSYLCAMIGSRAHVQRLAK